MASIAHPGFTHVSGLRRRRSPPLAVVARLFGPDSGPADSNSGGASTVSSPAVLAGVPTVSGPAGPRARPTVFGRGQRRRLARS